MLAAHRMMLGVVRSPPVFVAVNSATSSGFVTSFAIVVPAASAAGDLLVIAASMRGTESFSTPSGWTLASTNNDGISELRVWYRGATSGDPGSTVTVAIAGGGSEIPSAVCLAYANVSATSPLYAVRNPGDVTSTSAWAAGQIDLSTAPGAGLVLNVWASFPAGSHPLTMPSGVTGRADVSSVSNSRMIAAADEVAPAGSITPTRIATPSSAQPYVAVVAAFNGA